MILRTKRLLGILLLGSMLFGALVSAQTEATSSASASASGEQFQVSVGTFYVERGASMAFEITHDTPCTCLCDPIYVSGLSLHDGTGTLIQQQLYEIPVDAVEWLGRLSLVELEGEAPLPDGSYTVQVQTDIGSFSADLEIASPSQLAQSGRFSASASVCGLGLQVYRLLTEEDHEAAIMLRQGDGLMVTLAGNATTGFQWDNTLLYEFAVLRETDEMEYRPKPHPQEMVGFGGEFLFRYEAVAPGPQSFRFIYHRPWESVQPEHVVEFAVIVR